MAYATQPDMESAYGQDELSQIAPDGLGGIDADRVSAATERAASLADAYLGTRYVIPIIVPGDMLIGATADIARFYLYDDQATEEVIRRYDHAVAWLRDVSKGNANIPGATPVSGDAGGNAMPVVKASPTVFTDERLDTMMPWGY
jgi:phage gp36-like protein